MKRRVGWVEWEKRFVNCEFISFNSPPAGMLKWLKLSVDGIKLSGKYLTQLTPNPTNSYTTNRVKAIEWETKIVYGWPVLNCIYGSASELRRLRGEYYILILMMLYVLFAYSSSSPSTWYCDFLSHYKLHKLRIHSINYPTIHEIDSQQSSHSMETRIMSEFLNINFSILHVEFGCCCL